MRTLGRPECDAVSCFIHVVSKFVFFLSWPIPFLLSLFPLLFLNSVFYFSFGLRISDTWLPCVPLTCLSHADGGHSDGQRWLRHQRSNLSSLKTLQHWGHASYFSHFVGLCVDGKDIHNAELCGQRRCFFWSPLSPSPFIRKRNLSGQSQKDWRWPLPRFSVLNSPHNLPTLQTPKLGQVSDLRFLLLGLPRFASTLNDLSYTVMRN